MERLEEKETRGNCSPYLLIVFGSSQFSYLAWDLLLLTRINLRNIWYMTWISHYIHIKPWDVILIHTLN